ncbi:hypothetical protein M2277_005646 [Paenibacillus sp. LBL]|uniref:hypothetical protein n=1 Tax=Paenibacillus sp. LBL TaxID=2940563 RepID=UPI00247722E1|nr:hypothetical protein [Paenibacillus sp. LBL]MDH6674947.1 hypothetical protein [Paenibacillus sp. LBL]
MPKCHYCGHELEMAEYLDDETVLSSGYICTTEDCQVHKIVNLYFKPWSLSEKEIKERLAGIDVHWKWSGKFFFYVTPNDHYKIRSLIEKICQDNQSILFDSEIDYVMSCPEGVRQQIRKTYGGDFPILSSLREVKL